MRITASFQKSELLPFQQTMGLGDQIPGELFKQSGFEIPAMPVESDRNLTRREQFGQFAGPDQGDRPAGPGAYRIRIPEP